MMHRSESRLAFAASARAPGGSRRMVVALSALSLAAAGCARDRPGADTSAVAEPVAGAKDTGGMAGMKGMPMPGSGDSGGMGNMRGMSGMMGMMGDVQKQMDRMMKASPDQMKAMVPAHRQMAANMLAEMTAEMRRMNMGGDAAWTATVDSIRQDLVHMPELSGREMLTAMPAHQTRMMRLMNMHQAMTKKMRM